VDLVVRPARLRDRPAIAAIGRRIWQGWDYVPLFFRRWVRDGSFWVAELDGRVVGCGKATEFARGEWWLEGLRVDPDMWGARIGTVISERVLEMTLARRPASLRLATADVNRTSLHMIRKMGFALLGTHRFLVGTARGMAERARLRRLDPEQAFQYIHASAELKAAHGLMPYTWLFQQVTRRHVEELCRRGFVRGWPLRGELEGLLVVRPHRYYPRDLDISFVDGSRAALAAFRQHLFHLARRQGSKRLSAMPAGRQMERALATFGMRRYPGIRQVLVFEYPLGRSGRSP
jgi:GNAT superfamily N-acetyltransferase